MLILDFFVYLIVFISGLHIGSFLNLVADRLYKNKSIVWGKSQCEFCGKKLGALELIPVFSFLIQKSKCKHCKHKLSWYYPISELLTAVSFLALAFWLNLHANLLITNWLLFFFYIYIMSILLIILLSDMKYMIVPDKVILPAISIVLISQILVTLYLLFSMYTQLNGDDFGKYLIQVGYFNNHAIETIQKLGVNIITAFGIAFFFLFLIFITKGRGMGGGDVKLGLFIGLVNGFPNSILAIFIGFLTGAIYSVILVLLNKKGIKDAIPFGPFLIIGCVVSLFFGKQILEWYLRLI